ncbi:MAG: hypothetical protein KBB52_00905 [Candidatus Omnitrophica bacterium]|nr:hypothetical protein [Candidatus Omnitrophota bacterium]
MMKLQRIETAIVTTYFAFAAFILDCHLPDFLSPGMDSAYKILTPIAVLALFFSCQLSPPSSRWHVPSFALGTSCLVHSQMLYRLSYRGVCIKSEKSVMMIA